MTNIPRLIELNARRWETCKILSTRTTSVLPVAQKINAEHLKYQEVSALTEVPWWVIGIVHYREADLDFSCSLAQGDRWDEVSHHVPRGRGPFRSFAEAAVDALVKCSPFAARWKDWSPGGALTLMELYNGTGYEDYHHEASPYIWAATNHQEWGKYTADGHWDVRVWDTQLGCAALLRGLMVVDPALKI